MAGTTASTSGRNDSSGPEAAGRQQQPRVIKVLSGSLSGMAVSVALQVKDERYLLLFVFASPINDVKHGIMRCWCLELQWDGDLIGPKNSAASRDDCRTGCWQEHQDMGLCFPIEAP